MRGECSWILLNCIAYFHKKHIIAFRSVFLLVTSFQQSHSLHPLTFNLQISSITTSFSTQYPCSRNTDQSRTLQKILLNKNQRFYSPQTRYLLISISRFVDIIWFCQNTKSTYQNIVYLSNKSSRENSPRKSLSRYYYDL